MHSRILRLTATIIDHCRDPHRRGRGRPPAETIRVLPALRRFLREGTPWRGLVATEAQASGPASRRRLVGWAQTGSLARVHAMLVGMRPGHDALGRRVWRPVAVVNGHLPASHPRGGAPLSGANSGSWKSDEGGAVGVHRIDHAARHVERHHAGAAGRSAVGSSAAAVVRRIRWIRKEGWFLSVVDGKAIILSIRNLSETYLPYPRKRNPLVL